MQYGEAFSITHASFYAGELKKIFFTDYFRIIHRIYGIFENLRLLFCCIGVFHEQI